MVSELSIYLIYEVIWLVQFVCVRMYISLSLVSALPLSLCLCLCVCLSIHADQNLFPITITTNTAATTIKTHEIAQLVLNKHQYSPSSYRITPVNTPQITRQELGICHWAIN